MNLPPKQPKWSTILLSQRCASEIVATASRFVQRIQTQRSNEDLHAGDVMDKALNYIFAKACNSGVERRRCFAPDEL